jgi:hypothetical protein
MFMQCLIYGGTATCAHRNNAAATHWFVTTQELKCCLAWGAYELLELPYIPIASVIVSGFKGLCSANQQQCGQAEDGLASSQFAKIPFLKLLLSLRAFSAEQHYEPKRVHLHGGAATGRCWAKGVWVAHGKAPAVIGPRAYFNQVPKHAGVNALKDHLLNPSSGCPVRCPSSC